MGNTRPELSIDEIEPTGAMSVVRFGKRHWTKIYGDVRAALFDAVLLGMLDDAAPYMEDHRSEPNDWNLFTILPDYFEEEILERHGWTLEDHLPWVM